MSNLAWEETVGLMLLAWVTGIGIAAYCAFRAFRRLSVWRSDNESERLARGLF